MHELAIAQNILETVLNEITSRNLTSVSSVGLRIGRLTNVDSEALRFGYECLVAESSLAGSRLDIEDVLARAKCHACGSEFKAEDFVFICSQCSSGDCEVVSGQELDIVYIESSE